MNPSYCCDWLEIRTWEHPQVLVTRDPSNIYKIRPKDKIKLCIVCNSLPVQHLQFVNNWWYSVFSEKAYKTHDYADPSSVCGNVFFLNVLKVLKKELKELKKSKKFELYWKFKVLKVNSFILTKPKHLYQWFIQLHARVQRVKSCTWSVNYASHCSM